MTSAEFRAARKKLGLTQAGLAALLDMSVSQIGDYESGCKRGTGRACVIPRVVELALEAISTTPARRDRGFSDPSALNYRS